MRDPKASLAVEVRQLRDSLGLTPKGKQDRRWQVVERPAAEDEADERQDAVWMDDFRRRLEAA